MITVKEIESYKDYGKVISISNGIIETLVTVDVGPRVIFFGKIGGQNIMNDNRECFGTLTDEAFENFFGQGTFFENLGGHRIWLSPESYPETYNPDNYAVDYKKTENGAVFSKNPKQRTAFKRLLP